MKKKITSLCLFFTIVLIGCQNESVMDNSNLLNPALSNDDKAIIQQLGLDINTLVDKGDYYLVEGDIALKKELLKHYLRESEIFSDKELTLKQGIAGNNRLVSLAKVKNMTIRTDASIPTSGIGSDWRTAVQTAVNAWNNVPGSCVNYVYTTAATADITVKRTYENSDNIAWTGLPSNEIPANEIYVNSKFDSYVYMANTMIHEMGHSIGLLHSHATPESQGGILIPGTPQVDPISIMSYDRDRSLLPGFSANDIAAIRYLYPNNSQITASAQSICPNELITYSFTGLTLTYPISLTWQAISNAAFVSSQGTSATFRTIGNGFIRVRANVNYNYTTSGYSFSIPFESANVWAGVATQNASVTNIDISPSEYVGSLTLGGDIQGATKYEWYGSFPPQYKGSKTNSIVIVDRKHIISQGGMYIIVEATNACGIIKAIYNVTVGGSGIGPD